MNNETRKLTSKEQVAKDNVIRADWTNLTYKQRMLIKEYLKNGKKLTAYKKVYYPKGDHATRAKKNTLNVNCYAEFKKPYIKAVIRQIQEQAILKAEIPIENIVQDSVDDLIQAQKDIETLKVDSFWVLQRAAKLADFNINQFIKVIETVDANGNPKSEAVYDFADATDDDWYCIQEYVTDKTYFNTKDGDVIPVDKLRLKAHDKVRALELVARHVDVGAIKDTITIDANEQTNAVIDALERKHTDATADC